MNSWQTKPRAIQTIFIVINMIGLIKTKSESETSEISLYLGDDVARYFYSVYTSRDYPVNATIVIGKFILSYVCWIK